MNEFSKNKLFSHVSKLWDNTIKYKEQRLILRGNSLKNYQKAIQKRVESLNIYGVRQMGNGFYNIENYGFTISTRINSKRLCLYPSITNTGFYLDKVKLESFDVFVVSFFQQMPFWVSELSKKEKITLSVEMKIEQCIEELMKELNFEYSLQKETSKITLKIKLKTGFELDIPFYHSNFPLTLLHFTAIIEQYAQLQNINIPIIIKQYRKTEYFAQN